MIRQTSNVRLQDVITRSNELLTRLGIEDLDLILKERRLRWYGHVECSNGAVKTAFHIQVKGKRGPGRPKMTWKQLTERDCREWKLSAMNPRDSVTEYYIYHFYSLAVKAGFYGDIGRVIGFFTKLSNGDHG